MRHKKWSFKLKISSVNVTKSAVSCGLGLIYWRNPYWKILFFGQWINILKNLSKIFENIMYKQMTTFMDKYFSKFQCGFKKDYSTHHITSHHISLHWLKNGKVRLIVENPWGASLTDLSKAFVFLTSYFQLS